MSEEIMNRLLPCPFCGGEADYDFSHPEDYMHEISCSICDITLMGSAIAGDLINHWNTRITHKDENL